jgi:hypothetical protein
MSRFNRKELQNLVRDGDHEYVTNLEVAWQ